MEGNAPEGQVDSAADAFMSFVTNPDYRVAKRIRDFLESFDRHVKRSEFAIASIRAFVDSENLQARTLALSASIEAPETRLENRSR